MTPTLFIRKWALLLGTILLALFFTTPWDGRDNEYSFPASAHAGFFSSDLDIFGEVLDLVSDNYVYAPDFKNLFAAAIQGMIDKLEAENLKVEKVVSGQILDRPGFPTGSISANRKISKS